ncbi:MAG: hypothetical protein MZV64_42350 [Ignavibacteriales bacterium]|nr:hypothetical protein [Ignavibacteriales bacterium]
MLMRRADRGPVAEDRLLRHADRDGRPLRPHRQAPRCRASLRPDGSSARPRGFAILIRPAATRTAVKPYHERGVRGRGRGGARLRAHPRRVRPLGGGEALAPARGRYQDRSHNCARRSDPAARTDCDTASGLPCSSGYRHRHQLVAHDPRPRRGGRRLRGDRPREGHGRAWAPAASRAARSATARWRPRCRRSRGSSAWPTRARSTTSWPWPPAPCARRPTAATSSRRSPRRPGIQARVITGVEEAALIHQAAVHGIDVGAEPAVVIDIGGGSTEITLGTAAERPTGEELPAGRASASASAS